MPSVEVHSLRGRVLVEDTGGADDRCALVFVHGAGGGQASWYPQRRFFGDSHKVYVVELPGHGEEGGIGADTVDGYAEWVKGALDRLEVCAPYVIGHSMGGAIAMELALRWPNYPRGLVLAGTGARLRVDLRILDGIQREFSKTVELIGRFVFTEEAPPELVASFVSIMGRTAPAVLHADFLACDRFDRMDAVYRIQVPTLVICGDRDLLTPVKYSRYLVSHIPDAQFAIIEGAGHMLMLECPDAFNHRLKSFVDCTRDTS
jgi:pimeloyl-ACP methyl ester carboxylesterase